MQSDNVSGTAVNQISENGISLVDWILILWRGKYIIVTCAAFVSIAGLVYALMVPEVYSTSSVFVTKTGKQVGGGNLSQLASLAGISIGGGGSIDPSGYLDKVIQDKDFVATLFERKWFVNGDSIMLDSVLGLVPDTTHSNWMYVFYIKKIDAVRKGKILTLRKDAATGLLTLISNASDPQLAYDLNTYTLEYVSTYMRNSLKSQAKEKRIFIEGRIKESCQTLEKSEEALAKFRASNLMTRAPLALLEEARLTREVTMNQELYIQFQKQYELARIEELDNQALVQMVKGPEVPVVRSSPKRKNMVVVSGFGGVFFGVIVVVCSYLFSNINFVKKANLSS